MNTLKYLTLTGFVFLATSTIADWTTNPQGEWVNGPAAIRDYGDAPDSYATYKLSSGPSHILKPGLRLGARIDGELDGMASATALTDDTSGADDDDGVSFTTLLRPGHEARANVSVTGSGKLDAWIDFNKDGHFNPDEQICRNLSVTTGTKAIRFLVPEKNVEGFTYARFRLSTAGNLGPSQAANDGEVEDYRVALFRLPNIPGNGR